jgi:sugar lactone lactonase YvrE
MDDVRVAAQVLDRLGEGPFWSAAEGRLYWFDIQGRILHWHDPETGSCGAWTLPYRASCAAPRAQGGLIAATERGLAFIDSATGALDLRQPMDLGQGFRTNDGKVAPDGRFWWSTMDDAGGARPGRIYVTDGDGFTEPAIEGVHIANAISHTPDGRTLYLADSTRQTIWAYDAHDLTRRRVFAQFSGDDHPDGSALDADGFLWVAVWGGWRVVRLAPDGSVDREVRMPVEQPSCPAFGGPDLATLYVTSAWEGLSDGARIEQPLAGCLFAFEPGVSGLPLPAFAA